MRAWRNNFSLDLAHPYHRNQKYGACAMLDLRFSNTLDVALHKHQIAANDRYSTSY